MDAASAEFTPLSDEKEKRASALRELEQEFDTRRATLSSEIAALARKRDDVTASVADAVETQGSRARADEIAAPRQELSTTKRMVAASEKQLEAMQAGASSSDDIQSVLAGLRQEREHMLAELTDLTTQAALIALQARVAEASETRDQLEAQNEELSGVLARQEERRDANLAAIAGIERDQTSKSEQRDDLSQKIRGLLADQASVLSSIGQLKADRGEVKREIARLAELVETKIAQLTKVLSGDLASIKDSTLVLGPEPIATEGAVASSQRRNAPFSAGTHSL